MTNVEGVWGFGGEGVDLMHPGDPFAVMGDQTIKFAMLINENVQYKYCLFMSFVLFSQQRKKS